MKKKQERLVSAAFGKLVGKSQAGLGFGASGVLVAVLEAQGDKAITSQHRQP